MICMSRRARRSAASSSARQILARRSARWPARRLDQAQHQRGRASTCRSPIRRPAPASRPRATLNVTPSTARTVAERPAEQRRAAPGSASPRSVDLEQRLAHARHAALAAERRAPAARQVPARHLDERRRRRRGSARSRERAARRRSGSPSGGAAACRAPARRSAARRSRCVVEPRDRAEQADRVGMLRRREQVARPAPRSTIWPAYITTTSSAISATTPRSWVIRMIAVPRLAPAARASGRGSAPGW